MNDRSLLLCTATLHFLSMPILASTEGLNQEAYLKSTDIGSDGLGSAVAVSGRFAVVTAPAEDSASRGVNPVPDEDGTNSGAAYVYERIGGVWTFHSFLKSSNSDAGDNFGTAAALDGDLLAISATDEGSNAIGVNEDQANNDAPNSGAVYIFRLDGDTWVQEAYLKASNPDTNDRFGNALALDGETLVVGAEDDDGNATESGSAYVFVRSNGTWTEQARLNVASPRLRDEFGAAVAIAGDTLVVGSPAEDGSAIGVNGAKNEDANLSGAAYVFTRSGEVWTEVAYLKASNTDPEDRFGSTVAISGNTIAVGSVHERGSIGGINPVTNNDVLRTGAVYVFVDNGAGWETQATIKAAFPTRDDEFGNEVVISGDLLVVASLEESGASSGIDADETTDGAASSGAVYLFTREGSTWTQARYLKASNAGGGDKFGTSIALHSEDAGDLLLVGAPAEDGSSPGVNGPDNDSWGNAGAAYAFVIPRAIIGLSRKGRVYSSDARTTFPRTIVKKRSRPAVFTIHSEGYASLSSIRLSTLGKSRRSFRVTKPSTDTVAPDGSVRFKVTFRPTTNRKQKATLRITSNASNANPFTHRLEGRGRS